VAERPSAVRLSFRMSWSRSLVLVLACFSAHAGAQIDPEMARAFLPFQVGDAWEYAFESKECEHVAYGGECTETSAMFAYRVADRIVRDGDTLAVIESADTQALFGIRSDGSGWITEVVEAGAQGIPPLPPLPSEFVFRVMVAGGVVPWTFDAGGVEYSADALTDSPPPHVIVRDLGVVFYHNEWRGTGGASRLRAWRLTGALVSGVRYGVLTTSTPHPAVESQLHISVGPNPTAGPLTVRIERPTPGPLHIELVDVLGRTLWTVDGASSALTSSTTIPTGDLPAGVYVIRVRENSRLAATMTVTRVKAP